MTHNIVKLSNLLTQLLTRVHSGKLMCWNFGMCIGVKYMFSLQANKLLYLGTTASQEYVLLSQGELKVRPFLFVRALIHCNKLNQISMLFMFGSDFYVYISIVEMNLEYYKSLSFPN